MLTTLDARCVEREGDRAQRAIADSKHRDDEAAAFTRFVRVHARIAQARRAARERENSAGPHHISTILPKVFASFLSKARQP